ncbi:MAG: SprT family zinc-dependent metalloprotease [Bdellovibrionota bacterium]
MSLKSEVKINLKIKLERVPRMRGFKVSILPNSTVVVRLGKSENLSRVHGFIDSNQAWLKKCLEKTIFIQSQYPQLSFIEGEAYRFLGENYFLKYEKTDGKFGVEIKKPYLILKVPTKIWKDDFAKYPHPQFRKNILKFYQEAAERVLPKRVKELAEITGLKPTKVSLRKQRTLWGSCSPSGSIQLNWKLISAPINVIDYVVIHELAHLKHPNHSKRFWNEVAIFCPDYKQLKLWLKKHYYSFDHLNETSELHSTKWKSDLR